MSVRAFVALAALTFAGCGRDQPTTPEAAVQQLLEAARGGDAAAFRAAFPSREEIGELFACPADLDPGARLDNLSDALIAWRDTRPELVVDGVAEVTRSAVRAGDDVGGCKARRAMTLVRGDVRLRERGSEVTYAMRFVDLEGRVRVLGY